MGLLDVLLRKVIQIAGVALPERKYWNFLSGATAADNPATGATDITITAGGGGSTPTGTGFTHQVAGVTDGASKKVDLTAADDVTVPATANGVVTSSGAVLQQAANVLAGANFVSIGATPAASGSVRTSLSSIMVTSRNSVNSNDDVALACGAADNLYIGIDAAFSADTQFTGINVYAGAALGLGLGSSTYLYMISGATEAWNPITGSNSGTSPYSVHGTVISSMTDADYAVPAAEYAFQEFVVPSSLTLTAGRKFKLPTPATEAGSYTKEFINTATGSQTITLTRADGAGVTVAVLTATKVTVRVRPGGVYIVATAIAAP